MKKLYEGQRGPLIFLLVGVFASLILIAYARFVGGWGALSYAILAMLGALVTIEFFLAWGSWILRANKSAESQKFFRFLHFSFTQIAHSPVASLFVA